jgi:hypothetical protein
MKSLVVIFTVLSLILMAVNLPWILPAGVSSSRTINVASPVSTSCVNRYNALLKTGKADLIAGNRAASVDALRRAERMLASCPALQDDSSSQARALVLDMFTRRAEVAVWQPKGLDGIGCRASI